jgi:hypothetical protein
MKKMSMLMCGLLLFALLAGCGGGGGGSADAGSTAHTYQGVVPAVRVSNSGAAPISGTISEIVSAVVVTTTQPDTVSKSQTVFVSGTLWNDTPNEIIGAFVQSRLDVKCDGTRLSSPMPYSWGTMSSIASGVTVTVAGGGTNCGPTNPGFPLGTARGEITIWDSEENVEQNGHLIARARVTFQIVP